MPPRQQGEPLHLDLFQILSEAKRIAQAFYQLTGKPLGVTGEVAEYEAARLLGVELTPARQAGYDAVETIDGSERRLQIKGRVIQSGASRSQRLGSIDINKDFDAVLMVLLDERFNAAEIWEADRDSVIAAIIEPGSRARNERYSLPVGMFKSIGKVRWTSAGE